MDKPIAYDPSVVGDFATDVGSRAGQLEGLHHDTAQLTNALQEFFEGHGAAGFFDAQYQMLSGLQGLVDTVRQHGITTSHVLGNAISVDQQMPGLFWT
ncbi:WXG100 family type VII secretion target [Mycobacterium sp. 050134]|uniref:WXG100 family type VII secretion target n=1 Tax=Mycobacterium sp. 050134 TaxID=3096111 RepID=UPI002EDA7834